MPKYTDSFLVCLPPRPTDILFPCDSVAEIDVDYFTLAVYIRLFSE
jgi:hypothetical protein